MASANPTDPPASARPSTSEAPPPKNGPVDLFDVHLHILTDSYLVFFTERRRIEETYIDSLQKLHTKIRNVDRFFDPPKELSTTRSAWNEVRDNLERELQTRNAFLGTLTSDVIQPLSTVKETQERTRKRVKEDIKESISAYNEYADVTLPKLRTRYTKKFAEVEEQKQAALSPPPMPLSPQPDIYSPSAPSKPYPAPQRPVVTSPQPLRALDRRPSGSAPSGRNRSPSSSTAFSDLAHQGKRQLNTLIGFLDKSGSVKDSLGNRENHALRTVRAKRELDEADKEYRNGVHWLETLRLRRAKIMDSAYKSFNEFVLEASRAVKRSLERYTDNMTATTTTQTQLTMHVRAVIDKISPEKDVTRFANHPNSLASPPHRVLYYNGMVGECQDLIFGFSLMDYAMSKNLPDGELPKIVRICISEIDLRGLELEGIYRVSGRHAVVQAMQREIERDEGAFRFSQQHDVYAVASLLKLYLRELPEPIFKYSLQDRLQHTEDFAEHQSNNFALLRAKMRRLPPVHQATLKALLEHLSRVVAFSEKNKMDAKNVAIVFGGLLFGEDEMPKAGDLLSVQNWKDTLMEDLIMHAHVLFDDAKQSAPLPPTPSGEEAPKYSYGSKTTKFTLPAPLSLAPSSPATTEDFTPRLPARPANSIHPSLRAGQASPTKERMEVIPPMPIRSPTKPAREFMPAGDDQMVEHVDTYQLTTSPPSPSSQSYNPRIAPREPIP